MKERNQERLYGMRKKEERDRRLVFLEKYCLLENDT